MTVDHMLWFPDRDGFVQAITSYGLARVDEAGALVPAPDVSIDEIGHVIKSPSVSVAGHHVNIRVTGTFAEVPAADLMRMIPGLVSKPATSGGVPAGYVEVRGGRIYDPATIATPFREWG